MTAYDVIDLCALGTPAAGECGGQLFAGPARDLRTITTVPVAGGVL